jgi:hypothetical protein
MKTPVRLTALVEFVGKSGLVAWIPSLPGIPQVIGPGLVEVRQRLVAQLRLYFLMNFPEQSAFRLDIILIIPCGNQVYPSGFRIA